MKFILSIIPAMLLLGLIFGGIYKIDQTSCFSRWEGSGMSTMYSFFGGCKIQLSDGKWIPEDRYREFADK